VGGTLNLLEAARRAPVENFVLASSSSVYGDSSRVPFREEDSATDRPVSPYAATKKSAELLAHVYHRLYGLMVNVVRPFTVYGPRGRPDMAPWLFVAAAVAGRRVKRFGDGTSARDYTYIDDFVQGFLAALDRPCGYEIFNLGNSTVVPLNEAIDTIAGIHGRRVEIEQLPEQPGDVRRTQADISKARRLLDYNPQTSFRDGMTRFYAWYRQVHQD
jgi:UDP-glucuronate 4-epimerase